LRILWKPAHVADLADCVLYAYSKARVRVPIGTIFKLFLVACWYVSYYAYIIYTYTYVYGCTRPRARYNGQRTMAMCVGSSPISNIVFRMSCFVCCVLYYCMMYFRCTLARNSRRGRGEFVLHKISRSTARGDVAGCILRSYLPLLSKRRMPRSEPALFSPQYTQGRATRAHSHSHFHFHPRNCCGLWPWWRVE
jgi:hypothetical protein